MGTRATYFTESHPTNPYNNVDSQPAGDVGIVDNVAPTKKLQKSKVCAPAACEIILAVLGAHVPAKWWELGPGPLTLGRECGKSPPSKMSADKGIKYVPNREYDAGWLPAKDYVRRTDRQTRHNSRARRLRRRMTTRLLASGRAVTGSSPSRTIVFPFIWSLVGRA